MAEVAEVKKGNRRIHCIANRRNNQRDRRFDSNWIWCTYSGSEESIPEVSGIGLLSATLGAIGLVLAISVIIGAVLICMPRKEVIGGVLVLVFSIISLFFTLGRLIIGLILGMVVGALGIAKK